MKKLLLVGLGVLGAGVLALASASTGADETPTATSATAELPRTGGLPTGGAAIPALLGASAGLRALVGRHGSARRRVELQERLAVDYLRERLAVPGRDTRQEGIAEAACPGPRVSTSPPLVPS